MSLHPDVLKAAQRLAHYRQDFPLFAAEQLKIVTKEQGLQSFVLRTYQDRLYRRAMAQMARDGYVRQVWMKSRQLGTSTLSQGLLFWRTVLNPYTNSLVVAHDAATTSSIFNMARTMYDHLDKSLRPMLRYSTKTELVLDNPYDRAKGAIPGFKSSITVATAKNLHSGAGRTLQNVHCSEAARYPNPEEIETSTLHAVPATNSIIIIESTAWPTGHWFREMCDLAREGRSPYEFAFDGWDQDPTCRVPLRPGETLELDDEEQELQRQYGFSAEQLKWRRAKIQELRGDRAAFDMSFPLDYESAWSLRKLSVFPREHLLLLRKGVDGPKFRADLIPPGRVAQMEDGPLAVWEPPVEHGMYDIGADVGVGIESGDWSAAVVTKRPTNQQVAEYRAHLSPGEFADALAWLGHYYNTAQIACEVNSIGQWTNAELIKRYPNVYIDRRIDRIDQRLSKWGGFETTRKSKNVLVARAKDAVYRYVTGAAPTRYALIRSEALWDELSTFVRHEDQESFGAAPGHHDDTVMAWMLALRAAYDEDLTLMGVEATADTEPLRVVDPAYRMSEDEVPALYGPKGGIWADAEGW